MHKAGGVLQSTSWPRVLYCENAGGCPFKVTSADTDTQGLSYSLLLPLVETLLSDIWNHLILEAPKQNWR